MSKARYYFDKIERRDPAKRSVNRRVQDFDEIYRHNVPNTLIKQATRCVTCGIPRCEAGCPLTNRIADWSEMDADGQFLAASKTAFKTNPLPEVTGRICPKDQLCESQCILKNQFGAVTIGEIERFISECYYEGPLDEIDDAIIKNNMKVAVIGSGPAGFSCADFLSRLGYSVTVIERDAHPGGLLYYGIPTFKMEREIIHKRIKALQERGVEFQCNREFGQDVTLQAMKDSGFRAFFIGIGAKKEIDVPRVEGRASEHIITAYPFLTGENGNGDSLIKMKRKKVLVLGGGDTAMDCARTTIRKGAREVTCVYRESEDIRPGSRREYETAQEEGIRMVDRFSPVEFTAGKDGRVKGVTFVKIDCSETDENGCLIFKEIPGTEISYDADVVILSFGFTLEVPSFIDACGIETDAMKRIKVDSNQMTRVEGVFAGGDITRGSSLVVHALRDGREAAFAIGRYLRGKQERIDY
jgi:glutamate synthase (NADPH/NADH) small chain